MHTTVLLSFHFLPSWFSSFFFSCSSPSCFRLHPPLISSCLLYSSSHTSIFFPPFLELCFTVYCLFPVPWQKAIVLWVCAKDILELICTLKIPTGYNKLQVDLIREWLRFILTPFYFDLRYFPPLSADSLSPVDISEKHHIAWIISNRCFWPRVNTESRIWRIKATTEGTVKNPTWRIVAAKQSQQLHRALFMPFVPIVSAPHRTQFTLVEEDCCGL